MIISYHPIHIDVAIDDDKSVATCREESDLRFVATDMTAAMVGMLRLLADVVEERSPRPRPPTATRDT